MSCCSPWSPDRRNTWPDVGSISRRIALTSVVLPQPDSPTRPNVEPSGMSRVMPLSTSVRVLLRNHTEPLT